MVFDVFFIFRPPEGSWGGPESGSPPGKIFDEVVHNFAGHPYHFELERLLGPMVLKFYIISFWGFWLSWFLIVFVGIFLGYFYYFHRKLKMLHQFRSINHEFSSKIDITQPKGGQT